MTLARSRALMLTVLASILITLLPAGARASVHVQWRPRGMGGGGTMFSAAVKPDDPNTVLMGSDVGGIFRSSDGGLSWQMRNSGPKGLTDPKRYGTYGVLGLTFDP